MNNLDALIVGVDPGNTAAVAAVTLDGELKILESGKNFPPRDIIQELVGEGKPVVVASDKEKTPSKVEKIASSLGAELYEPDEDLDQRRKEELGEGENSHEVDAAASALNAYRNLKRERDKIEKLDAELDIERSEIAQRFFSGEHVEPKEKDERELTEEETHEPGDPDREKLRMERTIERQEKKIERLEAKLGEKNASIEKLENRLQEVKDRDRSEVLKEEEVKKRESIIREKNDRIDELEEELDDAEIRNRQYRKALKRLEEGHEIVPVITKRDDEIPEKAATRSSDIKERLGKKGVNVMMIDELDGLFLGEYMVVEEFPDKSFRKIIDEYRESR